MNSFKYLLLFLFFIPLAVVGQVQNNADVTVQVSKEKIKIKGDTYYLHTVKKGENLYRICKAYGVTSKDIVIVNPETISGSVKEGQILKIPVNPAALKNVSQIEDDKFIRHIVEDGQTVFFLSQKYKISKEDLYKYNPELEVSPLQKGQIVNIPKNLSIPPGKVVVRNTPKFEEYKVKRKETKYSITRQFNITVDELIAANPVLNSEDLQVGQIIQIPVKENAESIKTTPEKTESLFVNSKPRENSSYIPFSENYKIALFIPFFLDENETISMVDSINGTSDNDKHPEVNDIFQKTQNFIEFYQGILLAIDSLKKCGMKLTLYTYDTGRDTNKINNILKKPELAGVDLIIGPFYADPAERVARFCQAHGIKMVSPASNNNKLLINNPNVFEVIPNESLYADASLNYIECIANRYVIFIQSDRPGDKRISELYRQKLDTRHMPYKLFNYNDNSNQLNALLNSNKDNIIVFPSEDEGLVNIIFPILNKQIIKDTIKVFGMPLCVKFKKIADLDYFYNLNFHYPSTFYTDFANNKLLQQFLSKYKAFNFGEPYYHNRDDYPYLFTSEGFNFAYLGYDIGFYFLNCLGHYGKDFENYLDLNHPDLLHTTFSFEKFDNQSGFINKGVNIIRYTPEYTVEKIWNAVRTNSKSTPFSSAMKK